MIPQETARPVIKVYGSKGSQLAHLKQLFYGMEEESVPFEYIDQGTENAIELSYQACRASVLGVGIGFDDHEIVLHYEKLKKDKPLFRIPANSVSEEIRRLGTNSARLVKKEPFNPSL